MPERERERIGPFVITDRRNLDPEFVICAQCAKRLARVEPKGIIPSCEALIEAGAVAWPNFGWFCSVSCEENYISEFRVRCSERVAKEQN